MAPTIDDSVRLTGTVLRYDSKRGFGHITPAEGGENVFVFWDQILSSDKWPRLDPDIFVEYYLGSQDDGRPGAFNVTGEGGIELNVAGLDTKILSETRHPGTVKFFAKAGYGFISLREPIEWPQPLEAGAEIYVSREEINTAAESACSLHPGMNVEFNVYTPEDKEGKVAAANVTAPGGVELNCQPIKGKGFGKGKGKYNGKSAGPYGGGYGMGFGTSCTGGYGGPAFGKGYAKGNGITNYAAPRAQALRPQAVPQQMQKTAPSVGGQRTLVHGRTVVGPAPVVAQKTVVSGRTVVGPVARPGSVAGKGITHGSQGVQNSILKQPSTMAAKAGGVQRAILKQPMAMAPKAAPAGKGFTLTWAGKGKGW